MTRIGTPVATAVKDRMREWGIDPVLDVLRVIACSESTLQPEIYKELQQDGVMFAVLHPHIVESSPAFHAELTAVKDLHP